MKVKNLFFYNNISIVWQLIKRGLQIIHHCTLQYQAFYIFIGEINDFNPFFMKPFDHFSPKILRVMTRCNKVLEGFTTRKEHARVDASSTLNKKAFVTRHLLSNLYWNSRDFVSSVARKRTLLISFHSKTSSTKLALNFSWAVGGVMILFGSSL